METKRPRIVESQILHKVPIQEGDDTNIFLCTLQTGRRIILKELIVTSVEGLLGIWNEWCWLLKLENNCHVVQVLDCNTQPYLKPLTRRKLTQLLRASSGPCRTLKETLEQCSAGHFLTETRHMRVSLYLEYFEGTDLQNWRRPDSIDPQCFTVLQKIFCQTALAVKVLHDRGIVHQDIKPANFRINEDNYVKVCDFGGAVMSGRTVFMVYTPIYVAPERLQVSYGVNARSDIYSLGVTWAFVAGGRGTLETSKDFYDWLKRAPKKLGGFVSLIKRMVAKDPQKRPTIDEILRSDVFAGINIDELENWCEAQNREEPREDPVIRKIDSEHSMQPSSDSDDCVCGDCWELCTSFD